MKTRLLGRWLVSSLCCMAALLSAPCSSPAIDLLHEFPAIELGFGPNGGLNLDGTNLYGAAMGGGAHDLGTVFRSGTGGADASVLHEFAGGADDGRNPYGSLVQDGTILYGTTCAGGDSELGVVFKMNTDGSGFQLLHEFAGAHGTCPVGSLTRDGTILYGATMDGGASYLGTIFKINTDGSGFDLLHEFAGTDGRRPVGSLTRDGTILYGATQYGGASNDGVIFRIGTDGSGFDLLREFADADGSRPQGGLTRDGTVLYGVTYYGGYGGGVIFKMNTDGSGFQLLHEFAGGADDGRDPRGSPLYLGGALYGMTPEGGDSDIGVIFKLATTHVNLASFTAEGRRGGILIAWETASEIDNAGFNVWRGESEDGSYERITSALVPARGGPADGARYSYDDTDVEPGKTYWYKLEDIDSAGRSAFHGPIAAEARPAWRAATPASLAGASTGAPVSMGLGAFTVLVVPAASMLLMRARSRRERQRHSR